MKAQIEVDPDRELTELQRYLGSAYRHEDLQRHRNAVARELYEVGDEQRFYRSSDSYLYDLTAFAMSGAKLPYLRRLVRHLPPGGAVLDYGCGIGSDGLALLEAGFRVAFADFDNPSTRYLRWRLDQRGFEAPVYDLDAGGPPSGFDAAYALDVIEHVEDPHFFLQAMESRAEIVAVNLLEDDPSELAPHHELPIPDLVRRAAERGLLHYRRYHGGRSHLLIYAAGDRVSVGRPASARRLLAARVEHGAREAARIPLRSTRRARRAVRRLLR